MLLSIVGINCLSPHASKIECGSDRLTVLNSALSHLYICYDINSLYMTVTMVYYHHAPGLRELFSS